MVKHYTTSVFIINKTNNVWVLMLIFHKKFNKWMVPGGHIELHENPLEGAKREAKEETGLDLVLFSFKHENLQVADAEWLLPPEYFYEQLIPKTSKEESHYHLDFSYFAYSSETCFKFNTSESSDIKWVPIEQALNMDLFEGTKLIIRELIESLNSNIGTSYEEER
jgi:8-oxo-dGTP pyrophosphatase MutT (NUDIX family)